MGLASRRKWANRAKRDDWPPKPGEPGKPRQFEPYTPDTSRHTEQGVEYGGERERRLRQIAVGTIRIG